jgi:hypothetical protein
MDLRMDDIKAVEYEYEIRQVKTMVDGSTNVTLNLPIHCKEQATWLFNEVGRIGVTHKGITQRVEIDESRRNVRQVEA